MQRQGNETLRATSKKGLTAASLRRHEALQLIEPVDDDVDVRIGGRFDPAGTRDDQQPFAVGRDVIGRNLPDLPLFR